MPPMVKAAGIPGCWRGAPVVVKVIPPGKPWARPGA